MKYEDLMFVGKIFNFKDENHFNWLVKVCETISQKDSTFKFKTDTENKFILILSEDKDKVFKRCLWLTDKADKTDSLVFDVKVLKE